MEKVVEQFQSNQPVRLPASSTVPLMEVVQPPTNSVTHLINM